ncbi:hypothetical protein Barb7_03247 [Bacteroidales bacterium Barb7]|nr:hypothetical protein Barb7_03247 [Bacteroidales bacterium Barb7]
MRIRMGYLYVSVWDTYAYPYGILIRIRMGYLYVSKNVNG